MESNESQEAHSILYIFPLYSMYGHFLYKEDFVEIYTCFTFFL